MFTASGVQLSTITAVHADGSVTTGVEAHIKRRDAQRRVLRSPLPAYSNIRAKAGMGSYVLQSFFARKGLPAGAYLGRVTQIDSDKYAPCTDVFMHIAPVCKCIENMQIAQHTRTPSQTSTSFSSRRVRAEFGGHAVCLDIEEMRTKLLRRSAYSLDQT